MDPLQIVNNPEDGRFQALVGEHLALLNYQIQGGVFQIDYVYVPVEFRGRGIAGALMEAALAYARTAGLRVVPVCGYARSYIERSATDPQYPAA